MSQVNFHNVALINVASLNSQPVPTPTYSTGTVLGTGAEAAYPDQVILGTNAGTYAGATSGNKGIAIGINAKTNLNSVAVGYGVNITGTTGNAVSIGLGSSAANCGVVVGNLSSSGTGTRNVTIGYSSGGRSGDNNISIGYGTLSFSTSGDNNVAIGRNAQVGTSAGYGISLGMNCSTGIVMEGLFNVAGATLFFTNLNHGPALTLSGTGEYVIDFNAATTFDVFDPLGNNIGGGSLGVLFSSNHIQFQLNKQSGTVTAADTVNLRVQVQQAPYTTGPVSVAMGYGCMAGGISAIAIGYKACATSRDATNLTGIAIGYHANAAGGSVSIGWQAGYKSLDSTHNVAIGPLALKNLTGSGDQNVAIGSSAGLNNVSGSRNVFVGGLAGFSSSTATNSTCIGYNAQAGDYAIALGPAANAGSGASNIAIGNGTGATLVSGDNNIAIGSSALSGVTNVSAVDCIAIGRNAGKTNASAPNIICIGKNAYATGHRTIVVGADSYATGGNRAIVIGTMASCTFNDSILIGSYTENTGGAAIALGFNANAGLYGIAIGRGTIASGNQGISIGKNAYSNQTNAVALGPGTSVTASAGVAIGPSANVSGSTSIAIGSGVTLATANACAIKNISGKTATGGATVLVNSSHVLGTVSSTRTQKTNVRALESIDVATLDAFEPKRFDFIESGEASIGLFAEDVHALIPEIVPVDADGTPFSIRYDLLSVVLLKAVRDLTATVENLTSRIEQLEAP